MIYNANIMLLFHSHKSFQIIISLQYLFNASISANLQVFAHKNWKLDIFM